MREWTGRGRDENKKGMRNIETGNGSDASEESAFCSSMGGGTAGTGAGVAGAAGVAGKGENRQFRRKSWLEVSGDFQIDWMGV